ncbi:aldo/keto reductase [Telluribacter sp.]|jgi:aryl-alcohol dehydrogenase-like predicted oxidoreductase|uniref:aldo/keto reductase n=1 Tax=Telluribacter sp. TaxID=1978767 RepID=UPI002E13D3CA|nr:aldo/keto reductase [Telluribacter sp.]
MAERTTSSIAETYTIGGEMTVNRMGFGAMRITGEGVWGPPKDREEAIRVLKRTVELGINFIDTADSYGPHVSEELIAEALDPYPKGLVIATKGGLTRTGPNQWPINGHPDHLREALEGSLKRLKLNHIDLYQLHRIDPEVPFEDTFRFLQKAQEEGLVKHIGLSEVTVDQIRQAEEYVKVVSVQNMYSIDNRKWENELNYCEQNDLAFIPWFPLGGGNDQAIKKLEKVAQKYDVTVHQLALSWLLHHSPSILLIPGTSRVKHLEENLQAASISLEPEDLEELNGLG